jgi:hypothetical protein
MSLRLKNGFKKMSDALLSVRTTQITTEMTGNANFPTPTPTLDEMLATAAGYNDALKNCADGGSELIAIKNAKREALIDALHLWALYVLLTANGNEAVAISSGFQIAKKPAPAPPLTKPEAPILLSGINPGELLVKGKRVAGSVSYVHQYATDGMMAKDNWLGLPCSKSSCVISGLTIGEKYNCRIVAIGRKDQVAYSDVVSRVAA